MDINIGKLIQDEFRKARQELGTANLLIAGMTGVGKSTLINAVFEGDFASTGQGRPVTQHTQLYEKEGFPLRIFDTRGLEVTRYAETLGELTELVQQRQAADPGEHVHVAWLCISEDSRRVQEADANLVAMLTEAGVPVIAVITKARADQGFQETVREILPLAADVLRVRALDEEFDDGYRLEKQGLEQLVDATIELVPEGQKNSIAAVQKVSLEQKVRRARVAVRKAATAAGGAGLLPVPGADSVVIVGVQIGMLARISTIFDLKQSAGFLQTVLSMAAGVAGTTFAGRTLVSSLFKLVPGIGSMAGALVRGTTAATLTTALGEAYIAALRISLERSGGTALSSEAVARVFREQFTDRLRRKLPPG
jgi:uncharacterized protein (DUF697 family)/GTPase SAR1 family protein